MASTSSTEAVECSAQPLGIAFHPSRDIIAAGLVDGTIELHDYSQLLNTAQKSSYGDYDEEDDTILSSTAAHTTSCRSVLFSNTDDNLLISCGLDAALSGIHVDRACDLNANSKDSIVWSIPNAHPNGHGIHRMFQLPTVSPAGPLIATGDDEGVIRLWDTRLCDGSHNSKMGVASAAYPQLPSSCVAEWRNHTDFISGFTSTEDGTTLLSTSGDCTLSIYDVRKPGSNASSKPTAQSEHQEDELLSLTLLKNGKKVLTGTQEGVLTVWSYGKWQDHCDRFPGHPQSIDAILKIDEDTVITGSSDGLLRVVQILPDKLLGVVGDHEGFPVEELRFERDRRVIGSVSHDELIRLWDASFLNNDNDKDDDNVKDNDLDAMELMKESGKGLVTSNAKDAMGSDDEWEDMEDEEDIDMDDEEDGGEDTKMVDSDDSDDDSDDGNNAKTTGKFNLQTDNEKFFEDL